LLDPCHHSFIWRLVLPLNVNFKSSNPLVTQRAHKPVWKVLVLQIPFIISVSGAYITQYNPRNCKYSITYCIFQGCDNVFSGRWVWGIRRNLFAAPWCQFHPEDGGSMFLRNAGTQLTDTLS
jgi:hypothetical protein